MKFWEMLKNNKELIFKTSILLVLYFLIFMVGRSFSLLINYKDGLHNTTEDITELLFLSLNIYLFTKNNKHKDYQIKIWKKLIKTYLITLLTLLIIIFLTSKSYIQASYFDYYFIFLYQLPWITLISISLLPIYIYIKKIDQKNISEIIYKTSLFLSIYSLLTFVTCLITYANL